MTDMAVLILVVVGVSLAGAAFCGVVIWLLHRVGFWEHPAMTSFLVLIAYFGAFAWSLWYFGHWG